MCGHFGMMGPGINIQDTDIIRELGIVSQLRGRDGAGVYQIRSSNPIYNRAFNYEQIYKSSMSFSEYLEEIDQFKAHNNLLHSTMVDVVIGHVRAATRGKIMDSNAHPFIFENIVGAHNGTLKDAKYLVDKDKTDSELMFDDINTRGIVPVLNEVDRESAFAVVIYNRREQAVYFARNELRTLAFAFLKDRPVMYWASEKPMLKYILERRGLEAKYFTLNANVVLKIEADQITRKLCEDDPIKLLQVHSKLTRLPPIAIEKMQKALAEKKEKEAKAKEEAEKGTVIVKVEDKPPFEEGKVITASDAKIIPFPPTKTSVPQTQLRSKQTGKFRSKQLHARCKCGCITMNLLEQSKAARGKSPDVRYDEKTDTFYCKDLGCDPLVKMESKK